MNYTNTKELKDIFGIDITEKNRTTPYNAMRYFYAEMREKELRGTPNHFAIIGKEINCDRVTIYNSLLKAKLMREDKNTEVLYTAFKNKDKSLIEDYKISFKKRKAINQSNYYIKKSLKETKPATIVKVVTRFDKNKALMSNLKLAEFLRANKILKHELWDTPVRNISPNQWKQVRKINPKMFEEIINS
jgi:hypothetical protein